MRKTKIIIAVFVLLGALELSAQIQLDFKAGLSSNGAVIRGVNHAIIPNINSKTFPTAGIGVTYFLDKHFAIVSGVNYQPKGFNASEGTSFELGGIEVPLGVEFRFSEQVIDIPLHLRIGIPTRFASFYIKGGSSVGIGLGGNYKTLGKSFIDIVLTNDPIEYDTRINRTTINGDIGVGAELNYGKGKLILEGMYQKAFNDKINDSSFDIGVRNQGYNVKVGYAMVF